MKIFLINRLPKISENSLLYKKFDSAAYLKIECLILNLLFKPEI